jgi:energy-coupling factor transport system ATP-binding protein
MITLDGVTYTYPFQDTAAVADLSVEIKAGETVLFTGASGCGKSTIVRLINGLCPHFFKGHLNGRVRIAGQDNASRRLHDISQDVGTVLQDPEHQFFATTVEDEIAFVHEWRETSPVSIRAKVEDAVGRFELGALRGQSIHTLSEGQKQKVALAAVMSSAPRVLVLDEPTANLDPEATLALARKIKRLRQHGVTIVIVDHRLYWLADVVDRVVVMATGRIAAEGDFALLSDAGFRKAHGLRKAHVEDTRPRLSRFDGDNGAVHVEALRFGYRGGPDVFYDASFRLPRGVTGILGGNGSGKTTLARLLTGLSRMQTGRLFIRGRPVTCRQLLQQASIVLQNTDHQLHMRTVQEEVLISAGRLAPSKREGVTREWLERFGLTPLAARHPQSLSGGEKQRLVLACAMAKQPHILILDEPTSGLDGQNMDLISSAIRDAAGHGACVLLISHDLELIGAVCDHALRLPLNSNPFQGGTP